LSSPQGSPGNLAQFEEILFSNQDQVIGSSVVGIKLGKEDKGRVSPVAVISAKDHNANAASANP